MNDFITSVKAALHDRATSPLFGAFLLSWAACNYQTIVIFGGEATAADKISLFDTYFHKPVSWLSWINIGGYSPDTAMIFGFLLPVLLTLFYIYFFPALSYKVYMKALDSRSKLRDAQRNHDETQWVEPEKFQNLMRRYSQLEQQNKNDIDFKDSQIEALNQQIKKLQEQIANKTKPEFSTPSQPKTPEKTPAQNPYSDTHSSTSNLEQNKLQPRDKTDDPFQKVASNEENEKTFSPPKPPSKLPLKYLDEIENLSLTMEGQKTLDYEVLNVISNISPDVFISEKEISKRIDTPLIDLTNTLDSLVSKGHLMIFSDQDTPTYIATKKGNDYFHKLDKHFKKVRKSPVNIYNLAATYGKHYIENIKPVLEILNRTPNGLFFDEILKYLPMQESPLR